MEEILRFHMLDYEKKQNEFGERLPEMIADFRDTVLEAIKVGYLPLTQEQVDNRLVTTRVFLADNMNIKYGTLGDYHSRAGVIRIAFNEDEGRQKKTLFHELVHTLSGVTLLQKNMDENLGKDIEHQRGGLSFRVSDRNGDITARKFIWLDEAVTENIAMYLSVTTEGSYESEREDLETFLYEQGILREMVYNAYFENYDPSSKEKIPVWKELMSKINEVYPGNLGGPQILEKIEKNSKTISDTNDSYSSQ